MTNLKSGLSGCKIELLNDDVLRKYSSGEEYDERLSIDQNNVVIHHNSSQRNNTDTRQKRAKRIAGDQ